MSVYNEWQRLEQQLKWINENTENEADDSDRIRETGEEEKTRWMDLQLEKVEKEMNKKIERDRQRAREA